MFKLLKKASLWEAMDSGFIPRNPITYHLKYAQDVMAFKHLATAKGRVIGEVGADHSRVLPDLSLIGADCYAIDVYDRSIGGGKVGAPTDGHYSFFNCLLGEESRKIIPTDFFDTVFSISVVEHVSDFSDFFSECIRITKTGGQILHMVDIYLDDQGIAFQPKLAEECINFFKNNKIRPIENPEITSNSDFRFSTSLVTNGDDMMYKWNKQVPELKPIREASAVCCLMMGAVVVK